MNLEKDIPEYAMVPAKEVEDKIIQPITKEALYSPIQITNVTEGQKFNIVIEEDILVPDIKPDLKEILIMEGRCDLATREISGHSKEAEYINVSGQLCIETLYVPEKPDAKCPIISIETKIPFKEQCRLGNSSTILLNCSIDKIDYMVINERKYRVKASISVETKEYADTTINLFEGIYGEKLHVLRENVIFSSLALRKKDILSIKEYISPINDTMPGHILMKDIHVMENYKQLTADKIVVNGFICLNILYCEKSPINDAGPADNIHQLQEKVEFTQFIPLQHSSSISECNLTFDSSQLRLKVCQHEDGQDIIQLEGDLITYIELYRKTKKDVIVDGYHAQKNFVCEFKETSINTLVGSCSGEASVREIFVPEELSADVENILFTTGQIIKSANHYEQGKIVSEGTILAKIVCQLAGDENKIVAIKKEIPFRLLSTIPNLSGDESIHQEICLKDFWSEKINGKQLEFNATIVAKTDATKSTTFILVTNPAFEISSDQHQISPMIIYCCKPKDSLWQIAKRYRTAKESIMEINHLDKEELSAGQKLLIIR